MSAPKYVGTFSSAQWGTVEVWRAHYLNERGPLAVPLMREDFAPLGVLSVNMHKPECSRDSTELPADCFFVKTWEENEILAAEALASGLFRERPDLGVAASGFVTAPVWQLVGVKS